VVLFSALILSDRLSALNVAGSVLIALGAYMMVIAK